MFYTKTLTNDEMQPVLQPIRQEKSFVTFLKKDTPLADLVPIPAAGEAFV